MELPIIGCEQLDNQHLYLFKLLETAKAIIERSGSQEEFAAIAKALLLYTMDHFGEEEDLMSLDNYPDLSIHKEAHRHFKRHCESLVRKSHKIQSSEIVDVLQKWLTVHIHVVDRKYAEWKKSR